MNTPWGRAAVCDAHVHFFSRRFYDLLARQGGAEASAETACATLGWPVPPEQPEDLARQWVDELDRHGVAQACLIASIPGDEESVARAVRAFPERFFGYFMFHPLAPNALERLRMALDAGLKGMCLFPAMHGYSVADEGFRPVFDELASRKGAAVFVHCGVLSVGVRKKLGLPSLFDMRYSNPIDLHPVALRYPSLAFVIPHFGAGYFREALMTADLCPNVYLDTSSSNSWLKYQPRTLTLADVFARALDVVSASRLLFGTDSSFFPRGWNAAVYEQQVKILEELNVSAADAAAILGGNLRRILTGGTASA